MYRWEQGKKHKKVKETGTVIFNPRTDQPCDFDSFKAKFTDETLKNLKGKMGFEQLLLPQAQCFNGIYKARDVILHSRTGSGKTLGYALPIIERRLSGEEAAGEEKDRRDGTPFLLIFVFSTELAVQTQSVLKSIYGKRLRVLVPALEPVEADTKCDVMIGTIASLDLALRGSAAKGSKKDNDEEDSDDDGEGEDSASEDDEEEEEVDEQPTKDNKNTGKKEVKEEQLPTVSAKNVRAIVIDEVDTTLGPKYSRLGRRMKFLLKHIRKNNGSLADGLQGKDFRAHHYVLVGATIPNWVVKAGFLGVKKYYYRFVSAGSVKLPDQLECYSAAVPGNKRAESLIELLSNRKTVERTVVFTSRAAIDNLEKALNTAIHQASGRGNPLKQLVIRSLSPKKEESDRIQCMQQYNDGVANVLLCTDFAARGLDFVKVELVVMLTLPQHNMAAETFVHRAGRTARVDKNGKCIAFYDATKKDDIAALQAIETVTHIQFKPLQLDSNMGSSSSTSGQQQKKLARFQLKVKNSFKFGTATSGEVPTPNDILRQGLGDADFKQVSEQTQGATPAELSFAVPLTMYETVKKKLWKYDLKDLTDTGLGGGVSANNNTAKKSTAAPTQQSPKLAATKATPVRSSGAAPGSISRGKRGRPSS